MGLAVPVCPPGHIYSGPKLLCGVANKLCLAKTLKEADDAHCYLQHEFIVAGTGIKDWPHDMLPELVDPGLTATEALERAHDTSTNRHLTVAPASLGDVITDAHEVVDQVHQVDVHQAVKVARENAAKMEETAVKAGVKMQQAVGHTVTNTAASATDTAASVKNAVVKKASDMQNAVVEKASDMHALLKKKYNDIGNAVSDKVSDAVEAATQMTATLTGSEDDKVHNQKSSRRLSLPHVVQVNELRCKKLEDSPHKLFQVAEKAAVLGREPSNSD